MTYHARSLVSRRAFAASSWSIAKGLGEGTDLEELVRQPSTIQSQAASSSRILENTFLDAF